MSDTPISPPVWHVDRADPVPLRWSDGATWTEQTAPNPGVATGKVFLTRGCTPAAPRFKHSWPCQADGRCAGYFEI